MFFLSKVSDGYVVSMNYDLWSQNISLKLINNKHYWQNPLFRGGIILLGFIQPFAYKVGDMKYLSLFWPNATPTMKSLALHITSNGEVQSRLAIKEALINLYFIILNVFKKSILNLKFSSFSNNLHGGLVILEKSFKKRL